MNRSMAARTLRLGRTHVAALIILMSVTRFSLLYSRALNRQHDRGIYGCASEHGQR